MQNKEVSLRGFLRGVGGEQDILPLPVRRERDVQVCTLLQKLQKKEEVEGGPSKSRKHNCNFLQLRENLDVTGLVR